MPTLRTLSLWLAAFAGAALASVLGVKVFGAWEQVQELWDSGVSPLLLGVVGHPHFFRFVTSYPGFLLEEALPGTGFSLYISAYFALNVVLLARLMRVAQGRAPTLAVWVVFLAVHLFMNGRGVIAWSAWLICLLLCVRLSRAEGGAGGALVAAALALWLSTVSTGVFIVVVSALALFYLQFRRRTPGWTVRKLLLAAIVAPALVYIVQHLYLAIMKNVLFFGGGIDGVIHMLSHGLGRVLFGSPLLALCLIAAAAIGMLCLLVYVRMSGRRFTPLEQLLMLPIGGGMFGLTVLTLALPIFLVVQQGRAGPRGAVPFDVKEVH